MAENVQVEVSGPLFDLRRQGIIGRGIEKAVEDVAEFVKDEVEYELAIALVNPTGYYESKLALHKRTDEITDLHDGGVIYGPFLERGRYYPSTGTRFRGYSHFRKSMQRAQRAVDRIAQPAVAKMAKELS